MRQGHYFCLFVLHLLDTLILQRILHILKYAGYGEISLNTVIAPRVLEPLVAGAEWVVGAGGTPAAVTSAVTGVASHVGIPRVLKALAACAERGPRRG